MTMDRVVVGGGSTTSGAIATAIVTTVADINDPSPELLLVTPTQDGEWRLVTELFTGAWTLYVSDSSGVWVTAAPFNVPSGSVTYSWVAMGGAYVQADVTIDSRLAVHDQASFTAGLASTTPGSGSVIITGGLGVSGAIFAGGGISTAASLASTVATGTAPISVASTTVVPNLNVSQLLGSTWAAPGTIGSGTPSTGAFTTISATGVITSTLATGTAPFTVASTTVVGNLNASLLLGATWAAPGTIGSGTPSTGAFTTISASGVITSTLATGTAPFTIASTTAVANLNASLLLGSTWAIPGTIGSTTPSTGAFTTIAASGVITSTLATGTAPFTVASTTVVGNLNVSQLLGATWAIPGTIGSTTPNSGAFSTLTASGATTLTAGTASTTTGTGTLVVTGGVGLSGQLSANKWYAHPSTATDVAATVIGDVLAVASTTVNGTNATRGLAIAASTKVAAGVTDAGYSHAADFAAMRNTSDITDAGGTLAQLTGLLIHNGHHNVNAVTPVTTDSFGIDINQWYGTGTITNLYGIRLANSLSGGTVTNRYGIYINNQSGAATLNYAIYTNAGVVRIGDTTASTTTTTGAVTVAGGLGVVGQVTAATLSLTTSQAQNTVYAAPSGGAGAPSFRTLVSSDFSGALVADFVSQLVSAESAITGTASPTTFDTVYKCTGTSGDYTVTLPAVSGNSGKFMCFRGGTSTELTKVVTIDGNGTEKIQTGRLSIALLWDEVLWLYCDGVQWWIISHTHAGWQTFTPSITALGGGAVKGATRAEVCSWRRSGPVMEISFDYRQSQAGTAGSGAYMFGLPGPSTTIDTTYAQVGAQGSATDLGTWQFAVVERFGTDNVQAPVQFYSTTAFSLYPSLTSQVTGASRGFNNTNLHYSFHLFVPITGW